VQFEHKTSAALILLARMLLLLRLLTLLTLRRHLLVLCHSTGGGECSDVAGEQRDVVSALRCEQGLHPCADVFVSCVQHGHQHHSHTARAHHSPASTLRASGGKSSSFVHGFTNESTGEVFCLQHMASACFSAAMMCSSSPYWCASTSHHAPNISHRIPAQDSFALCSDERRHESARLLQCDLVAHDAQLVTEL
jgi:hypothetical protein